MVLYFSATGNTEYFAKEIARLNNDRAVDLLPRIREHDYSEISSDVPFVICSPVYVCDIAGLVGEFFKKTKLTGSRDAYFVFTSGGYAGISGLSAKRIAKKKGMKYKGCAELMLPQNYIATNLYDELEDDEIERRIAESTAKIGRIAETIRTGGVLEERRKRIAEQIAIGIVEPLWQRFCQPVSKFYAGDKCTGCGLCAERCPLKKIRMIMRDDPDGASSVPEWTGKRCAHCMSCIQNCPVQAIEFGKITPGKKRYRFKDYLYAVSAAPEEKGQ